MTATAIAIAAAAPAGSAGIAGELEALAARLRQVTVRIRTTSARFDAVGAGVLWRADDRVVVVTNAHVVPPGRGDEVSVESNKGYVADAIVVARDRERDLALLTLPDVANDWPPAAAIGDARSLRVGEIVVALGHPFGVPGALSVGVLHAVPNGDDAWIRADVRLVPGNSGGPLATLDGAIVGINCMIARGLGIAIPAHMVTSFVSETSVQSVGPTP
jgi:serine protease Do